MKAAMKVNWVVLMVIACFVAAAAALARPLFIATVVAAEEDGEAEKKPPVDNLTIPQSLDDKKRDALRDAIRPLEKILSSGADAEEILRVESRLKKARTKVKESALPDYHLARLYYTFGDEKKARKALGNAIALNPKFYEAHGLAAEVDLWLANDYASAVANSEKALAIYPEYGDALFSRGAALMRLDRYDESAKDLERAQQCDNRYAERFLKELQQVRKGPAWEKTYTSETENYIVKTPVSQEFADEIGRHAELIRRLYDKAFPDIADTARKFVILVHESRAAYQAAGGPQSAGGHYSPMLRTLNLFQYDKMEDTILVLYHEGLHQYLDEVTGKAPQWFNEGLGDYFSGAHYERSGGRDTMQMRPSAWRVEYIKKAIQAGVCPKPSDLMRMSQREMYGPETAGINYAMAWSIVYFCFESGFSTYRETFCNYFKEIRKGRSIDEAYAATWAKIDMTAFEYAWKSYTMKLSLK